jgi:hypothetical protein
MKQILSFQFTVLAIALTAIAASACKPKDGTPIPESGAIQLSWSARSGAPVDGLQLKVIYSKPDLKAPVQYPVTVPLKSEQQVPIGVRGAGQVVSLQSLEVTTSDGRSLYRLARPELDPIRMRAVPPLTAGLELSRESTDSVVSGRVTLSELQYWELPPRETEIDISSVIPAALDLFQLDDVIELLLRLRWLARTSEDHHDDIARLLDAVPVVDVGRLELLLDAFYFPVTLIEDMRRRERELTASEQPDDRVRLEVLHANIETAERLAEKSNRLVLSGLLKTQTLRFESAETLLSRLHSGNQENDLIFKEALNRLGGTLEVLSPSERSRMLQLASKKRAYEFAADVALDIFTRSEDRSMGFLLDLLRRFPRSPARDRVSLAALEVSGEITLAELAAILTPIDSTETLIAMAEKLLAKVKGLTSEQALLLLEQVPPEDTRDTLILMALRQAVSFDDESLRSLLLMATDWTVRSQICALALPKIAPIRGSRLAMILQVLPSNEARDALVFQGLALMSSLNSKDYGALSSLLVSRSSFAEFLEKATPRLTPFRMSDAVATADLLLTRAVEERDAFLVKAAEAVIDLSWTNLEELMIRASSEPVRARIRELARARLGETQ